jgi:transcriptional regulator with XRE-family HTH domain
MSSERPLPADWGRNLAKALGAIRKTRGLSTAEMAARMGLDRRSYANFEAGKGRLNVARVLAFAAATDSDAWAILAGVLIGAPDLPLEAADNKLLLTFFILMAEFEQAFGDRLRRLETAEIITAFREAFRLLEGSLSNKPASRADEWLREGAERIGFAPGSPGKPEDTS